VRSLLHGIAVLYGSTVDEVRGIYRVGFFLCTIARDLLVDEVVTSSSFHFIFHDDQDPPEYMVVSRFPVIGGVPASLARVRKSYHRRTLDDAVSRAIASVRLPALHQYCCDA
jgi:hypothetical protein